MANTITPKTDREKALLQFVMSKGEKGVSRLDIEDTLKISKPTVEKLIKGLGLKKVGQERRKEFFGIPEGVKVEGVEAGAAPATGNAPATGLSGQHRLPPKSGAYATGQARTQESRASRVNDEERQVLMETLRANNRIVDVLTGRA